jgi:hypothetical protein
MAFNINGTTGLTFNNGSTQDVGGIGIAQTWQNVAASRAAGTTYTNTTGKPIMVCISQGDGVGVANNFYINGSQIARQAIYATGANSNSYIVPNGANYMWEQSSGLNFSLWWELR